MRYEGGTAEETTEPARRRRGTAGARAALLGAALLPAFGGAIGAVSEHGSRTAPGRRPATLSHAAGAPPGHTGGFGEPTCRACHDEYELNLDGRLSVEGLPERYRPGETYALTVVLASEGTVRAGFQAALRYVEGTRAGRSAGEVGVASEEVVISPPVDGVSYVGNAASPFEEAGHDRPERWSFIWTAPGEPAGPVAFHAAANSANGDASPFGDLVYAVADTVAPPNPSPFPRSGR